jgi:hypothetical protein
MTEPIVLDLGLGQAAALLWHHAHDRRSVSKCATCDGERAILAVDREAGFCGDCLDRSRILDGDDLGGES